MLFFRTNIAYKGLERNAFRSTRFDKKRQKVQKIIRTISITGILKVIHSNKKMEKISFILHKTSKNTNYNFVPIAKDMVYLSIKELL